jgi:hypothetical protein
MSHKHIVPILIEITGKSSNPKLHSFFEINSLEDQRKAIDLWCWRSGLDDKEMQLEPTVIRTSGSISSDEWQNTLNSLLKAGATGVVASGMDLLERVGLNKEFLLTAKKNGLEIWTSESVFPVPEDELLHAV